MRVRRSVLITAAAVAAVGLIAGGTYAFAGDEGDTGAKPTFQDASSGPPEPRLGPTESPAGSPSADPSSSEKEEPPKKDHNCPVGKKQAKVEKLLNTLGGFGTLVEDGEQSKADCAAIKKFQKRYDIRPSEGSAGPLTEKIAKRLVETDIDKCDGDKGLVACIDLTHQTTWIMKDGEIIVDPTITRTGMGGGYQTPDGKFKIDWRSEKAWSKPYKVWLPYWQHFIDGMGFHETTTYIHDSFGSHGCVNLLHKDAVKFYETLKMDTTVHTFGRKPGT
jgi:hypothetical protein